MSLNFVRVSAGLGLAFAVWLAGQPPVMAESELPSKDVFLLIASPSPVSLAAYLANPNNRDCVPPEKIRVYWTVTLLSADGGAFATTDDAIGRGLLRLDRTDIPACGTVKGHLKSLGSLIARNGYFEELAFDHDSEYVDLENGSQAMARPEIWQFPRYRSLIDYGTVFHAIFKREESIIFEANGESIPYVNSGAKEIECYVSKPGLSGGNCVGKPTGDAHP